MTSVLLEVLIAIKMLKRRWAGEKGREFEAAAVIEFGSSHLPTFDPTTMYPRLSCSASNSAAGTFSIIQTPNLHSSNNPTVGGS